MKKNLLLENSCPLNETCTSTVPTSLWAGVAHTMLVWFAADPPCASEPSVTDPDSLPPKRHSAPFAAVARCSGAKDRSGSGAMVTVTSVPPRK